jgi:hypothetical protein
MAGQKLAEEFDQAIDPGLQILQKGGRLTRALWNDMLMLMSMCA